MQAFGRHGGRLAAAMAAFPEAPRPWLDLSTGINPIAYPSRWATTAERCRLPDPETVQALEALAAQRFGVSQAHTVVAVAGAETGLRLMPALLGPRAVAIAEPTYGGHAEAWRLAGADILPWYAVATRADAAVIVNPNNPDGQRTSRAHLLALADRLHVSAGFLIVDESFGEVAPDLSVAGAEHPAIIVLRSFGKVYGLAGLRLGFVIACTEVAERLRSLIGDWPISADALKAGLAAYADPAWLDRARLRLKRDAERLDGDLVSAGFHILGGTSLYRLASHPQAATRFETLCGRGVLTRPFPNAPDRLRFGIPHPGARYRLRQALKAFR